MKYLLTVLSLLIVSCAFGQSTYLRDSFILIDNINNVITAKTTFTYDDQNRLSGLFSDNNFSETAYPTDTTRMTTTYTYDNPTDYILRRMDILDEYSFVKSRKTSTLVDGIDVVEIVDSVYRTSEGTEYFRRRYLINENELQLETKTDGYVNADNLLDSITTIRYEISDGSIKSHLRRYNHYDASNNKIQEISITETTAVRLDTASYEYENNELTTLLRKTYVDGILNFCSKILYDEINGVRTTVSSTTTDCTDFTPTSSGTTWQSMNDVTPLDSSIQETLVAGQDSNFTMNIYHVDFSDEDAILLDHNDFKYVSGSLTYDRTRLSYYHINPDAVSTTPIPLNTVNIYPNPSNIFTLIRISSDGVFDQVQLYDVTGQLVRNIKTSVKSKMQIDVPENSGVYFLLLLKDGKHVASPKQLVVVR